MCAVSYDDVRAIAEEIDTQPMVVSLDPHTVGEVLGDARTLAQATDSKDAAVDLVREASARIDRVRVLTRTATRRPHVVALEWLDPPFIAGHWTPQLIEFAGGEDMLGFAGENSVQTTWEEVAAVQPDVVIVTISAPRSPNKAPDAPTVGIWERTAVRRTTPPAATRSRRRRSSGC